MSNSKLQKRVPGILTVFGSVLFVLAWHLCVIAARPAHIMEIATEIGSIPQYKEELNARELVPSGDGRALVFFKETETGLGTYFWDTDLGKTKFLFEQREKWYAGELDIVSWSPHDRYVACAYKCDIDPQNPTRNLDIYDGATGEPAKKILARWDSKFIWLSDESFAYSTYNQAWLVLRRAENGAWVQTRVIKRFGDGKLENLVATSPHSVAWRQENEIWTYDFDSGAPRKIWESTTNTLERFACALNGDLLLNCRDENGPLSIRLRKPELGEKQATVLAGTRRLDPGSNVKLSETHGQYIFLIMQNGGENSVRFVWDGMVESYALAGKFLYFVGSYASDPPGIWRYDINAKETARVDSALNKPLKYARGILPEVGTGKNAAGGQFTYHIWAPVNVKTGKKYPLVIGQTHYMWYSYEQIAPNAQWFFAFVDRPS
ncbi:MAG: hypothetical protein ACREFR_13345, partial [Limisphaerales bacterium]